MKSSKRIEPLRHLADQKVQAAVLAFSQGQNAVAAAEAKLQELRRYIHDYERAAGTESNARLLGNRQAFLSRLREAERFQAGAVEQARKACALLRESWLAQRRDLRALDRLTEIYKSREHRSDEQRTQKLMDEFALRIQRQHSREGA